MILSFVIKNDTESDLPLEPGETWKYIVNVIDPSDAALHMQKVQMSASAFGHTVMNVYLDDHPFDARAHWTDGAHADDFVYDESVTIHKVQDETRGRR